MYPIWSFVLAAVFAGFFWWGHKSGEVVLSFPFRVLRDKDPRLFGFLQSLYAFAAAGLIACGLGIWMGWLPA